MKPIYFLFLFLTVGIICIFACKKDKPVNDKPANITSGISATFYTDCNHTPYANKKALLVLFYNAYKYPYRVFDTIMTNSEGQVTISVPNSAGLPPGNLEGNGIVFLDDFFEVDDLPYNTAPSANSFVVHDTAHVQVKLNVTKAYSSSDTLYYANDTTIYHVVGPFVNGYVGSLNFLSRNLSYASGTDSGYISWAIGYYNFVYVHGNPNFHNTGFPHRPCTALETAVINIK